MKISDVLLEVAQNQHDTTVAQILTVIAEAFQKVEEAAVQSAENPGA